MPQILDKYQVALSLPENKRNGNSQLTTRTEHYVQNIVQCTKLYNQGSERYFLYQFYINFLSNLYFYLYFELVPSIDLLVARESQRQSLLRDGEFNKSKQILDRILVSYNYTLRSCGCTRTGTYCIGYNLSCYFS